MPRDYFIVRTPDQTMGDDRGFVWRNADDTLDCAQRAIKE
jgi:hypothetical protein